MLDLIQLVSACRDYKSLSYHLKPSIIPYRMHIYRKEDIFALLTLKIFNFARWNKRNA